MLWLLGNLAFNRRPWVIILLFSMAAGMPLPLPLFGRQITDPNGVGGQRDGQERGTMVVAVTFGRDGKVQRCRLLRSNAPGPIEVSTIAHILKHWDFPLFAGVTEVLPIVFASAPTLVQWDGDLMPPPDLFPYDTKKYSMKIRVTFGRDGWVERVKFIQPSGVELADQQTAEWIQIHWHHDAYANQVVDVPFEFSRAQPPPPPRPAVPPPAKPAPPDGPIAIPAIRVQ